MVCLAMMTLGCGIFDLSSNNSPPPGTVPQHGDNKTPPDSEKTPEVSPETKPDTKSEQKGEPQPKDESAKRNEGNRRISSFSSAKKLLLKMHDKHPRTFYCNCRFDQEKRIALRTCGYKVRKNKDRAKRIEFEHVVPASRFGHSFAAWTKGHPNCKRSDGRAYKGRRCAEKVESLYKLMQADLHNLQPAIGEVNGDRSNYRMSMIPGEARRYGTCDVEIDDKRIEPRPDIRGDIARTYLYMAKAYPGIEIMTAKERTMFLAWSRMDPVDDWERKRNALIAKVQGNLNPYIK